MQSPDGSISPGESKEDNEGFKDTSRGLKKLRSLKTGRKADAESSDRPNGIVKPNSRYTYKNRLYCATRVCT